MITEEFTGRNWKYKIMEFYFQPLQMHLFCASLCSNCFFGLETTTGDIFFCQALFGRLLYSAVLVVAIDNFLFSSDKDLLSFVGW